MPTIRSHAVINHDASTVWHLVRDVGSVADWFPAMSSSEPSPTGRVVTLVDGTRLFEDVVTLDDTMRRLQYRVRGGDLAIDGHLGTVDVIDLKDGRCVLVYSSEVGSPEIATAFDAAIGEAVASLDGYLRER